MVSENNLTAPHLIREKGRRLRKLRELAELEIVDLAPIAGVAPSTFAGWEYGKHSGLPVKKAEKMLQTFWDKGIKCTLNWLMYNIGAEPKITGNGSKTADNENDKPIGKTAEEQQIAKELAYFQDNNPDSLGFVIDDDSMLPTYTIGDVVAGIKVNKKAINKVIGLNCVVQLNDGTVLVRNLQPTEEKNEYALLCTYDNGKRKKILYGIEPASVAPIIWHRRTRPIP